MYFTKNTWTFTGTTNATVRSSTFSLNGGLWAVLWDKPASNALSTARIIRIYGGGSTKTPPFRFYVSSTDKWFFPRVMAQRTTGVNASSAIKELIPFADESVKIQITAATSVNKVNGALVLYTLGRGSQ